MFFSTLFISLLLSLADASPLAQRQTVDCSPNSSSGLKAECWKSLNVDQYIQDWMKANGTAADCANLGFAQCYLQFNGLTTTTCDLITSDTCPPPSSTDVYSSDQHFYVSLLSERRGYTDICSPLTKLTFVDTLEHLRYLPVLQPVFGSFEQRHWPRRADSWQDRVNRRSPGRG